MHRFAFAPLVAAALALAGCEDPPEEAVEQPRPVRVAMAVERPAGREVSLSGTVAAKEEVDLAFRIGGRLVERPVNVGDRLAAGDLVGRLDSEDEENALRAARAALTAAEAQLYEAEANYQRQAQLLERGFTTRRNYDNANQLRRSAESAVDAARAQLEIARNRLDDTVLYADAPGSVTARGAEVGEVVQAGRMIVRLAREGGRDAVFDAPADLKELVSRDAEIRVSLTMNPSVDALGRIREVSPQADPVTGTFRVRVGLIDPPREMRLGSTVTGRTTIAGGGGIVVPASALTRTDGRPAVWIVDPEGETVALREIEIGEHEPTGVLVTGGLREGEVVVTAGVQALRPGQRVRLLGEGMPTAGAPSEGVGG